MFANAGISVWNRVVGFDVLVARRLLVNVPWIAVPFEVISATLPARHLVEEERAVRDAHPRRGFHRPALTKKLSARSGDEEDDPAPLGLYHGRGRA